MKYLNRNVITSFVLTMSASTALADGMTLSDVVNKTLNTHPEYQQAQRLVDSAKEGVTQAKSGYLPKVDVSIGTGYERVENQSTINRNIADNTKADHADSNRNEASLSITQMLFDGFATSSRVEQAKYNLERQVSYGNEIAEKVAILATKAFYDVQKEEENLMIDRNNLQMHKTYQSQIQRRVRSGKSNKADLEQVNSRVALAEAQVIQREKFLEDAKSEFFRQVGMEAESLAKNEVDFSVVPTTLEEAIEIAYSNNPKIKTLEAALTGSKSAIEEARAAYLPRVDLELSADRDQNINGIDKKDHSEQAMVRMRYNLYNGGADKARHMASVAESAAAQQALEDAKRSVAKDVRSAWYSYQLTTKSLASLATRVKAAKATKIAYKSQFDVGQRTLLDVLDSEREYNSSLVSLETAKNDRDYAVYELLSIMGKITETFDEQEVILENNEDTTNVAMNETEEEISTEEKFVESLENSDLFKD